MKNAEIEELLLTMRSVIPELMREWGFDPDTCVLSTRIAAHLLGHLRIPYRVQPVQLIAYNAAAIEELDAGRPPLDRWDSHSVGLGFGGDETGYDGHLVAVVKNRWLLDLTLDQVSRPEKGIVARPAVWTRKDSTEQARYALIEGVAVYGMHDKPFQHAGDWKVRPTDALVLEARRRVLAKLPGGQ